MAGGGESTGETARRRAACRVGGLLGAVLPPSLRARAFAEAAILGDWALIVGPELAARCAPLALRQPPGGRGGATLELATRGGTALELQHAAPQLVERINGHLGYRAVGRLVLRQRAPAAPAAPPAPPPRAPDPAVERAVEADLGELRDPALREALRGLGRTLLGKRGGR